MALFLIDEESEPRTWVLAMLGLVGCVCVGGGSLTKLKQLYIMWECRPRLFPPLPHVPIYSGQEGTLGDRRV